MGNYLVIFYFVIRVGKVSDLIGSKVNTQKVAEEWTRDNRNYYQQFICQYKSISNEKVTLQKQFVLYIQITFPGKIMTLYNIIWSYSFFIHGWFGLIYKNKDAIQLKAL